MQEGKVKTKIYPLQMMDILDQSFNKISIDIITDLDVSTSGNQHILTIIDHLSGWLEAYPILDKKTDTIFCVFNNNYLPVHMCLRYILSNNGAKFRNQLMGDNTLGLIVFSAPPTIQRSMGNWMYSTSI